MMRSDDGPHGYAQFQSEELTFAELPAFGGHSVEGIS